MKDNKNPMLIMKLCKFQNIKSFYYCKSLCGVVKFSFSTLREMEIA